MSLAIWWIRRDLRLFDNQALSFALQNYRHVIPLFIIDPRLIASPPSRRDHFLFSALSSLEKEIKIKGSRLILSKGDPLSILQRIFHETGAAMVVAESDFSPYALKRDRTISSFLPLTLVNGLTVHPPETISKPDGSPYTVFTPYSKVWKSLPFPLQPKPVPNFLPAFNQEIFSQPIPKGETFTDFPANESAARKRLSNFLSNAVFNYKQQRNFMAADGSSRLSVYFKFGLISIRDAVYKVNKLINKVNDANARENCSIWLNELIWREFYFSILFHFPFVTKKSFRKNLRSIRWEKDAAALHAWKEGATGFPVVDAGMRQLKTTGWMHNRARMITASFLVKDLLINWQEGENWFMDQLIDGDLASNNGGWQWTAGTGTDAAPFFRIFNPTLQSRKFDPNGEYIRKWIPEIAHLDNKKIHTPWDFCDGKINYPKPIIDRSFARERALTAYKEAKLRGINQSK